MTLRDAKVLRDEVRERGLHCIVPLGHGPDGYFARIFSTTPIDFHDRASFRRYEARRMRERRRIRREYDEVVYRRDTRSPIERMIDTACGR